MATAREMFDEGIKHLGMHPLVRVTANAQEAARCFSEASRLDPMMCDAWLGLAYASGSDHVNLGAAHAQARHMYRETRRLEIQDGYLSPAVHTPVGSTLRIVNQAALAAGYAGLLISDGRYDDAEKVLLTITDQADVDITAMTAMLHAKTLRWSDVITTIDKGRRAASVDKAAVVDALAAQACAQLGQHPRALEFAKFAVEHGDPSTRGIAALTAGFASRSMNRQDEAKAWFEKATDANGALLAEAVAALDDDTYGLVTISASTIEARANKWDATSGPSQEELDRNRLRAGDPEMLARGKAKMAKMIGLKPVKQRYEQLERAQAFDLGMLDAGEEIGELESINMRYVGPPGTAKTSVARNSGEIWAGLGILASSKVWEVSRPDLVGGHIGETGPMTIAWLEKARRATLFIDEAPELYKPNLDRDFGREAMDAIMKWTEDNRGTQITLAGYKGPMHLMLDSNPGFASRFPNEVEFFSYTADEMLEIAEQIATERSRVILSKDSCDFFHALSDRLYNDHENENPTGWEPRRLIDIAANGRFARMVVAESAILTKDRGMAAGPIDFRDPEQRDKARTVKIDEMFAAARTTLRTQKLDPKLADF